MSQTMNDLIRAKVGRGPKPQPETDSKQQPTVQEDLADMQQRLSQLAARLAEQESAGSR